VTKARRLGVVFAVLALSALAVSPALAADLHQGTPIIWTDATQGTAIDCADAILDPEPDGTEIPSGFVLWRFTLDDHGTSRTDPTLTVQYTDSANADQLVVISPVSAVKVSDHWIYHYNVVVPSSYVLQGAVSVGDSSPDAVLNLSFVCGNPGGDVPEAPASALLILSAGLMGFFFLRRQNLTGRATAA
jgi:hypothetical protein